MMKIEIRLLKKSALILAGTITGLILIYLLWLPYVPELKDQNPIATSLMKRREKQAAASKKKLISKMHWKKIGDISPYLVHAVLLAEDDTFYQHHGFDFEQIKIAVKINWEKGRYAYGGSTLTQQLARTLYLSPSKSLFRKLKEAVITFWMEQSLTKKRILEIYLNVVEWGNGIYGAEAAALHYYGKSTSELSPEESVALASILPSPRKWSPYKETPFMIRRRSDILNRMRKNGLLPAQSISAKEEERLQISTEITNEDNNIELEEENE